MGVTDSKEKLNIVKSLAPSLVFLSLIWIVFAVEKLTHISFASWGIYPGSVVGLRGIVFSTFIHGDITHIANNSLPLGVLIGYLFTFYRQLAWRVIVFSILMSGFWVWASARPSYHIGASGLIYALTAFLFASGLIRRNLTLMAVSLTIAFLYGSMIWGIFPLEQRVSWESHLWGSLSGGILAVYFRKVGDQRVPYPWETVTEEEYLRDNIVKYGEFYWDPAKQAEIRRAQEEQHHTFSDGVEVVYFYREEEKG
jgi:membrane associated rhomboid family serine protease